MRLRIGPFGLDYDRDYGTAKRTGWTAVYDGCVVEPQLAPLRLALWALAKRGLLRPVAVRLAWLGRRKARTLAGWELSPGTRLTLGVVPYDVWVGVYVRTSAGWVDVYIIPLPLVVFHLRFEEPI